VVAALERFTRGKFASGLRHGLFTFIVICYTFGVLFLCRYELTLSRVDKRTGASVAIKVIDVENAEDEVDDIIQEIAILSELHSPYVTKYFGSYLKGSDLWIIMEFCSGGSCGDLLKPGVIPEDYITIILRELLMGLEYLHADNKLHRDIKGMV
jgi:serine/threonine protein kinase